MRHLVLTAIALFTFSINTMAEKGFDVQKEITINVSAAELWEMVGPGFVDVYKWSSNVDHAEGAGNSDFDGAVCHERFCDVNVKGFSKISEELTYYSIPEMKLAYAVKEGMPGFVTKAVNQWTVVPIDDHSCKLVMKAEFRSKGLMGAMMNGMMEKKMKTTLETVLNDAKVYAETGEVSEAKRERMAELDKKKKKEAA
ncbi:SRPBCC family protein [Sanyastnella coralliicola]|uniref:SRPBCC family protein n=1 Tax=Sanyastnella coralliicola TaxID=3069118 RepID=UPI0027B8D141|nr:SRPBCC family protein [Longitalea sp. SCSIO 12813]